jgi:hypothetical protein
MCGGATATTSTTDSNGCKDSGAEVTTATASGITGTVSVTVDCTTVGGSKCTANYDLIFTKQ